jgi:hypothetical protein
MRRMRIHICQARREELMVCRGWSVADHGATCTALLRMPASCRHPPRHKERHHTSRDHADAHRQGPQEQTLIWLFQQLPCRGWVAHCSGQEQAQECDEQRHVERPDCQGNPMPACNTQDRGRRSVQTCQQETTMLCCAKQLLQRARLAPYSLHRAAALVCAPWQPGTATYL